MKTSYAKIKIIRNLPENVREVDAIHFKKNWTYECPELRIYKFDAINLLPDSTLFKIIFPLSLSFLFFRKRLRLHNAKGILVIRMKWKKIKLKGKQPCVVVHDPWTKNYYHWITQALPRLLLVQQLNESFTLLLPEDHQSEFHLTSLKLLGIESWQPIERKDQYYYVHNLWYPTHDVQIGDYNDDIIRLLRNKLRKVSSSDEASKKIFIHRSHQKTRRIINEDIVLQTFLSFGFEVVEFEHLSFEEQILLAGQTKILAGVHGAGLTNMIFMPDHSTVFELTTKVDGDNYYYYTLSSALSHQYYYQVCNTDQEAVVQDANLIVDVHELKRTLTLMLSS
jgi:capsular polysaccharide biosynthesis protein